MKCSFTLLTHKPSQDCPTHTLHPRDLLAAALLPGQTVAQLTANPTRSVNPLRRFHWHWPAVEAIRSRFPCLSCLVCTLQLSLSPPPPPPAREKMILLPPQAVTEACYNPGDKASAFVIHL